MKYLLDTFSREFRRLCSRTAYLFMMIVVPLGCALFFLSLLSEGLPEKTPAAIVDLDNSALSRQVTRELDSEQVIDITHRYESYSDAVRAVQRGEIFGFFIIPRNFERNTIGGRTPSIDYYANMTYFVPGTLAFKGFKTIAVTTTSGMVKMKLSDIGADGPMTAALLQPVSIDIHSPGNPWTNYSYYLTPSFIAALLSLMIVICTTFSITTEIKDRTSVLWLRTAGGSIITAVSGKLLPQTLIFTVVGWTIQSMMFGYHHFPVAGNVWVMILAMPLFVVACQALALFICGIMPNPRLAMSVACLVSILTFSFAGFSFPVDNMYGAIAIFSYLVPVRYYFLLHINEVLWGAPLYYSRMLFVALILFPLVAMLPLRRLKRALLHPVYVP